MCWECYSISSWLSQSEDTSSQPARVFLNSPYPTLQVCTIMTSMSISRLFQIQPVSISLSVLHYRLQVHFQNHSIPVSMLMSQYTPQWGLCDYLNSPDLGLQVRPQFCLLCALTYISMVQWPRPPTESLSSHKHILKVHPQTHPINTFKCIYEGTSSHSPSDSISKLDILQPQNVLLCIHGWKHQVLLSLCPSTIESRILS